MTSDDAAVVLGTLQSRPMRKMSDPLMRLGAIYCAVLVAVAVWIVLMLFTRRPVRQRWSEHYQSRLRHALGAVQGSRREGGRGG